MVEIVGILIESLVFISVITGLIIWFALASARREDREASGTVRTMSELQFAGQPDPNEKPGRRGSE
jgi:hypothetical protein